MLNPVQSVVITRKAHVGVTPFCCWQSIYMCQCVQKEIWTSNIERKDEQGR